MQQLMRRPARMAVVVLLAAAFCFAATSCGGSSTDKLAQGISKDADQANVYGDEAKLDKISINGPVSEMFPQTQTLISDLQQARADGVSSSWIDKQISDSQNTVETVGCHDCFTALEDAR